MHASQVLERVRQQPFKPFRIHLSDGASYDVRHSDNIIITLFAVAIGVNPLADGLPMELVYCDPIHITRIVPINGSKSKAKRTRRS